VSRFLNAGNKDTLHTIPTARGIDIREELLKFYNTYYSAGVMCLAVYGKGISPIESSQSIKFWLLFSF
jgi:secreted Zn-dependent insulinase-like peptidase